MTSQGRVACTCDHEESDGRSDVLRCPVHGIGNSEADRAAFDKRTAEARRITSEALAPEREIQRLRALLKEVHDRDKWQGEFPTIAWYDAVARYFQGKCP